MSSQPPSCVALLVTWFTEERNKTKTKTVYWIIKTKLMSSTQCKDTKSYEHVNEHTTGRNLLTENYHTQQENAGSTKIQINLVSDILLGFISLLNVHEVVSLSFCKVERSRFRFENRLDLKVSCFLGVRPIIQQSDSRTVRYSDGPILRQSDSPTNALFL